MGVRTRHCQNALSERDPTADRLFGLSQKKGREDVQKSKFTKLTKTFFLTL